MVTEQAFRAPWEYPTRRPWDNQPSLPGHLFDPRTPEEIREENQRLADFITRMLKGAADYDKRTNQPRCEDKEKRLKLLELANELGVRITFPDEVKEGSTPSECPVD